MMHSEFEQLMKKSIPYENYLAIEKLYMFFGHLKKKTCAKFINWIRILF